MLYYTNIGVLRKEEGVYYLPDRAGDIEQEGIVEFCKADPDCLMECADGSLHNLDIAQLIVLTNRHYLKCMYEDHYTSFQYVDSQGNKIDNPLQEGYAPEKEDLDQTETEAGEEKENITDKEDEQKKAEEFIRILDSTTVRDAKQMREWCEMLTAVYEEIQDDDIKITINYEIEKRLRVYESYLNGLSAKKRRQLEQWSSPSNIEVCKIECAKEDLAKLSKTIDAIECTTSWDVEYKMQKQDEWLEEYRKLQDLWDEHDSQLGNILVNESQNVWLGIGLRMWKDD